MIRFFLVYAIALTVIGMGNLDTAERAFAARSVALTQATEQ